MNNDLQSRRFAVLLHDADTSAVIDKLVQDNFKSDMVTFWLAILLLHCTLRAVANRLLGLLHYAELKLLDACFTMANTASRTASLLLDSAPIVLKCFFTFIPG